MPAPFTFAGGLTAIDTSSGAITGTTITATTTFTGPSYTLTGTGPDPLNGIALIDANTLAVSVGGAGRIAAFRAIGNSDAGLLLNSAAMVGFASSTLYSVADVRLTRSAANQLMVSSDGVGTLQNIKLGGAFGAGITIAAGSGANAATTDVQALSVTQTWNNAAITFTAFKQNITDTASNAASLLMDLQVGGTSKAQISKYGWYQAGAVGAAKSPLISFPLSGSYAVGLYAPANYTMAIAMSSATDRADISAYSGFQFDLTSLTMSFGLTAQDTGISRISAGVIGVGTGGAGSFAGGLKLTDLTINRAASFLTTSVALTNGAGASAGTITNAPSVGNPTKWIGINDNGTVRYIPAW